MNRLAVSVGILIGLTTLSIGAIMVTDMFAERASDLVDEVESAYEAGDKERCVDSAEQLEELWSDFVDFSLLLNDMGQAIEMTSCVAEICSFAEEGNDELYAVCDRAQAQIELLKDTQIPTIWKVL